MVLMLLWLSPWGTVHSAFVILQRITLLLQSFDRVSASEQHQLAAAAKKDQKVNYIMAELFPRRAEKTPILPFLNKEIKKICSVLL